MTIRATLGRNIAVRLHVLQKHLTVAVQVKIMIPRRRMRDPALNSRAPATLSFVLPARFAHKVHNLLLAEVLGFAYTDTYGPVRYGAQNNVL